jgi:predicted molibdopterin-dependent oxidoreductase YjgC
VELSPTDADRLGIAEGDWVRVESPRGKIEVRARVGRVMPGAVFAPFHYGHWDPERLEPSSEDAGDSGTRTANELTMTVWDPVSKQPTFKTAACRVTRLREGDGPSPAPTTTASAPATSALPPTTGGGDTTSEVLRVTPSYSLDPSEGSGA